MGSEGKGKHLTAGCRMEGSRVLGAQREMGLGFRVGRSEVQADSVGWGHRMGMQDGGVKEEV